MLARILLQDFTGVPLLVDLAAMRSVAQKMGKNPKTIEPLVPVDLVVDHSVQIDHYGTKDALDLNMKLEFKRNEERYQFMKWGMQAFDTFKVVPPGIGIVPPGEPRVPGARRAQDEGRHVLSRHAGRHRQPHHHDQRHRRGGLGRGRHRGRGRHAGPAGLLPHARRGRVSISRASCSGVHRDRSGADGHRDAAQGQGGRQVRRVLRRRHGLARGARPRHDRQHGAGVRRDHGLLPGRRQDRRVLPRHRPHRRGDRALRRLLQGAGHVRHARKRATSTTRRCSSSTSRPSIPRSPARSARRIASTSTR